MRIFYNNMNEVDRYIPPMSKRTRSMKQIKSDYNQYVKNMLK